MLKNPPITGISEAITLRTYLDEEQTRVVDEDKTNVKVNVAASSSPLAVGVTATNSIANGLSTILTFSFTPAIFVPASGVVRFIFPNEFTLGSFTAASCQIKTATNSASCVKTGNIVTMTLTGAVTYSIGVTQTIAISGGVITNPVQPGTYIIDVTTFQADGTTLLESYSDFITLSPQVLAVGTARLIGCQKSNSATAIS